MWWQQHFNEFVTFLLVINPIAALPVFLSVAASLDPKAQRRIALHSVEGA